MNLIIPTINIQHNTDLAVVSSRAIVSIMALLFNVRISSRVFNEADVRPEV